MSSRLVIALAFVVFGCSEDEATPVNVAGLALSEVELVAPNDKTANIRDTGSYRWFMPESPTESHAVAPTGGLSAKFVPDIRGTYLVERWFVTGVGEDLTHRFFVMVDGLPPTALPSADSTPHAVGISVLVDGSASSSAEGRPLTYHWRLAHRPLGSQATLEQGAAQTHIVPDVAGEYVIELAVFDGELWNEGTATAFVNAL